MFSTQLWKFRVEDFENDRKFPRCKTRVTRGWGELNCSSQSLFLLGYPVRDFASTQSAYEADALTKHYMGFLHLLRGSKCLVCTVLISEKNCCYERGIHLWLWVYRISPCDIVYVAIVSDKRLLPMTLLNEHDSLCKREKLKHLLKLAF